MCQSALAAGAVTSVPTACAQRSTNRLCPAVHQPLVPSGPPTACPAVRQPLWVRLGSRSSPWTRNLIGMHRRWRRGHKPAHVRVDSQATCRAIANHASGLAPLLGTNPVRADSHATGTHIRTHACTWACMHTSIWAHMRVHVNMYCIIIGLSSACTQ